MSERRISVAREGARLCEHHDDEKQTADEQGTSNNPKSLRAPQQGHLLRDSAKACRKEFVDDSAWRVLAPQRAVSFPSNCRPPRQKSWHREISDNSNRCSELAAHSRRARICFIVTDVASSHEI